jgi:NAD+ kinase
MLISIGGDGTILRAATLIRDSGILYILTQEDWGFGNRSKENIDEFLQVVIEKKYTLSKRTLLSLSCPLNEALQDKFCHE